MIPIVRIKHANYENVIADCHWCGHECIFNRASDLETFEPIWGKDIRCLNESCQKPFRIVSDTANERHEMLIFECYQLLERKQYMYCILNLTTAYEMFFSLFLRASLLYKPFVLDPNSKSSENLDRMNTLSRRLDCKTRKWAFIQMRKIFLSEVTGQHFNPVVDLDGSEARIVSLKLQDTPECRIRAMSDTRLIPLIMCLKNTGINNVRNDIVHKKAYRPTKAQAEKYLEEAGAVLFKLTRYLDLRNDFNYWVYKRPLP